MTSMRSPQRRKTQTLKALHWRAPAAIFFCLLVGILVAVVHHCIYQALENTVVASDEQQRWVIRGGTALAFLFKLFLTISTGTAYVQQLWLTVAQRPLAIDEAENMFEILKDITGFLSLHWLHNPLLALTAIITWAIPISAIITPGTLIVQLQPWLKSQDLLVPALDMESNKWYYLLDSIAEIGYSPTTNVTRVSISSMIQGTILPMQPQHSNSSYITQFYGPAVRCRAWNKTATEKFQQQYCKYFHANFCPGDFDKFAYDFAMGEKAVRYLAWPEDQYDEAYNATNPPFLPIVANNSTLPFPFDTTLSGILHFYVGQKSYGPSGLLDDSGTGAIGPDILTTCTFTNASYTANFSFTNNIQHTAIVGLHYLPLSERGSTGSETPLQRSYIASWAATSPLLIGTMVYNVAIADGLPTTIAQTQIQNSALDPLTRPWPSAEAFGRGVEELFQNITLSAFSLAGLTTNSTASPTTAVNYTTYRNVYTYQAGELWKAYGTGIGVALLCALIGLRAMLVSGKTFKNSFSTILRTTRAREFDDLLVNEKDLGGAEPLSKNIKDAVVVYTEGGFRVRRRENAEEKVNVAATRDDITPTPQSQLGGGSGRINSLQINRNNSDARSWAKRASARITSVDGSIHAEGTGNISPVQPGSSEETTEQAQSLLIPRNIVARKPVGSI